MARHKEVVVESRASGRGWTVAVLVGRRERTPVFTRHVTTLHTLRRALAQAADEREKVIHSLYPESGSLAVPPVTLHREVKRAPSNGRVSEPVKKPRKPRRRFGEAYRGDY